ncbi:hypothetical protein KXV85_005325, partial [Aspergillus fumigatus]
AEDADQGGRHGRHLPRLRQVHREDKGPDPWPHLHQRVVRRLHGAGRRIDAARAALCHRRHRHPGGAGGLRVFQHRAGVQERAREILPGRGAGLRLAGRLCRRERPDPGHQEGRPADRHREAARHQAREGVELEAHLREDRRLFGGADRRRDPRPDEADQAAGRQCRRT